MRLLFALPHVPWPPVGGGRTRSFFLSNILAEKHETHVFALKTVDDGASADEPAGGLRYASIERFAIPSASPPRYSREWLSLRLRTLRHPAPAFYRSDAAARLEALARKLKPDVIVYGMSWMLPYASALQDFRGVVDEQNYDPLAAERVRRDKQGLEALKWSAYVALAARAERRNLRLVQGVAACSEEEAAIFRREAPHADVALVPNGVDAGYFRQAAGDRQPARPIVIMTGSYSYAPNADGARRLATRIWPIVRASLPEAECRIVGLNGREVLGDLSESDGVTVVGSVEDVRDEMAAAAVATAPLDSGGGTRLKILEAFAAGLPVVSTTVGAEGIALADGREAFIRDGDEEFAHAIIRLLQDPGLAREMGERGRKLVTERYDWRTSAAALDALLHRVAR